MSRVDDELREMSKIFDLVIIGYGDIGRRVSGLFIKRSRILGITRSSSGTVPRGLTNLRVINVDLDSSSQVARITKLCQNVVYLAPPNQDSLSDDRLRTFLNALQSSVRIPHRFVYVSTTGVYGDRRGEFVTETDDVNPQTDRARRRVDAERQLRAWSRRHGGYVSILRVPGIYSETRLPIDRLKQGVSVLQSRDDSYSNHIHAHDLARLVLLTLFRGKSGRIYNCCDESEMRMGDYFDLVADRFSIPRPPRVDRDEAERTLSPMLLSFMNESRRVSNVRMKRELMSDLKFPSVEDGLVAATTSTKAL